MKKIVLFISCVLLSAHLTLIRAHSQAACEDCGQQLLNDFDPEWQRWGSGRCSCHGYNQNCQEDSSEFAHQLQFN